MTLNASPTIISTVSRKPRKLPSPNDTPEKQTENIIASLEKEKKCSSRPNMQPNKQATRTHTAAETCHQTADAEQQEKTATHQKVEKEE